MSGDYRPQVGDIVKIEAEVVKILPGNVLVLGAESDAYVYRGAELVRRKAPVLEPGDVVYANSGGVYLIGRKQVSFTCPGAGIIDGGSVDTLADFIAKRPSYYNVVKHKENAK